MIILNLGRREVGKTTLAYYSIGKCSRRVIFDPRGLFPAVGTRATTPEEVDAIIGHSNETVITPDTDLAGCFDAACDYVKRELRIGKTGYGFLIDELRFVPRDSIESADLNWILRCATRDSVSVVFTAHRPTDVITDIRAISDIWCIFQMTQENDLKIISERCTPEVAERVAKLKPREFVSWDDAIGRMAVHTHPERWYVPLRSSAAVVAAPDRHTVIDDLDGSTPARSAKLDFTQ